jgi:hypothetical protein
MANADIIKRILDLSLLYEGGRLSAIHFESELEHHVSALERMGSTGIDKSRDFSARLVHASSPDPEYPGENPAQILVEFKSWLSSLPI